MNKKAIFLALIILLSVFSMAVSAEDNLPTIFADALKTENNTVELTLSISENSGIAGCSFNIVYDSEKLTYSSHELGETIASTMSLVNPEYNANAIRVLWADTQELLKGGEIIKVVFDIDEGASGSTDITIDKLKMMDVSSNSVDCSCENPTVVLSSNTTVNGNSGYRPPVVEVVPDEDKPENDGTEEDYEVSLLEFDDVKETDWYFESVRFANFYHLMSGVSATKFAPMNNLTRGMLVTILYRLEGEPECMDSSFDDVENGSWYSDGIAWAAENKVVNGIGNNKFAPNSNITREQIALIMYNYSKLHSLDVSETKKLDGFKDSDNVSLWAKDALEWAVGTGLLSGKGTGILDPKGNATRAEIATILMRYVEKYDQNEV